jgi:hypothetical protein
MDNYKEIWNGNLPAYWDINKWFHIVNDKIVFLYKNDSGKRLIEVKDIISNEIVHSDRSIWNSTLGSFENLLYFCKLDDARTHLQVSRFTCYDIVDRTIVWSCDSSFLIDKYKVPEIVKADYPLYNAGNLTINLLNGEIHKGVNLNKEWKISKDLMLIQDSNILRCVDGDNNVIWERLDYFGNWFQGSNNNIVFFLLPNDHFQIINISNGEIIFDIALDGFRRTTAILGGEISFRNNVSFNNTSIYDLLVYEKYICWINEQNELIVINMDDNSVRNKLAFPISMDVYLTHINKNSIYLYDILDYKTGKIISVPLEG